MLRSTTEARVKSLMSCSISSMVGNGYSFHFKHWLILLKSITSLIVPFFLGIPKADETYSLSLISSAVSSHRAPILHCPFNSSLKTSHFFNGIGYGLAQNGLAPSTREMVMGVPFHSLCFSVKSNSCLVRTCKSYSYCSFIGSWQSCATCLMLALL